MLNICSLIFYFPGKNSQGKMSTNLVLPYKVVGQANKKNLEEVLKLHF